MSFEFRRALRNDLRASPYSDHKVLLGTLVGPSSSTFGVLQLRSDDLLSKLTEVARSAGPIEISIPDADARITWTPNAPLPVVVHDGSDSRTVTLRSGNGPAQTVSTASLDHIALLLVAPAEPMARRVSSQTPEGDAIQARGESQIGIARLVQTPFGLREVAGRPADNASILSCEDDPSACEGGGGGSPPADTTFLSHLVVLDVVDNGQPWQTNEFEWRALYVVNGTPTDYSVLRITGIPKDLVAIYNAALILRKPSPSLGAVISVNVVETDAFGDDTFPPTITLSDPSNYFPAVEHRRGADKCLYAQATFGFPCYPALNNPYRETNQQFRFN